MAVDDALGWPLVAGTVVGGGFGVALWTVMAHFSASHPGWAASFVVGLAVGSLFTVTGLVARVAMRESRLK